MNNLIKPTIQISASLLSADFLRLGDEIRASEQAGVQSFHLDVMDAHLAPNISYGPPIIQHIRRATHLFLDAHLMIDQPWLFLDDYIACQVNGISLHVESYDLNMPPVSQIKQIARKTAGVDLDRLRENLRYIRSHNIEAGITLNPNTDLDCILPVLSDCDSVLIMSVNPGFSGQSFMPAVLDKIKQLRSQFSGLIKVDGGINAKTAPLVITAGADVLITASYLYASQDYRQAIQALLPS